jgi:WhiB family redox-sensing transcriptional regulator
MTQNRAALELLVGCLPEWMSDAACKYEAPDLFFPEGYGKEPREKTERAIAICNRCPVKQACFDYSLATRQRHGTWGGVDERTRAKLLIGKRRMQAERRRQERAS